MSIGKTVLELKGIHKRFGNNHVLRGVDLEIHEHEVVAMIGASGSGKSTLMKVINLLETVDDGQIILNGQDIANPTIDQDKARAEIGVVFQHYNLFPHMTVLDNVTLANRVVRKIPREKAEAEAMDLLKRIGIDEFAKRYPDQLSGGQQQRVAISRAILTNPVLLLLDEITSALDPQLVGEVLDLVMELKSEGKTILMATHEMGFARKAADRIIFLHKGAIAEDDSPEEFFENPKKEVTREFLSRLYY